MSRVLHFIGTSLLLIAAVVAIALGKFIWLLLVPFTGCGFAWVRHFFFERNKPVKFKYPLYSLASDFNLLYDILRGRQGFEANRR